MSFLDADAMKSVFMDLAAAVGALIASAKLQLVGLRLRSALVLVAATACGGRGSLDDVGAVSGAALDAGPVPRVVQVSAGWTHTCAVLSSGAVRCWGDNARGQLGDGTVTARYAPVDVVGLGGFATAVSAGGSSTCALLSTGSIRCWGLNEAGELGDGTITDRYTPVDVTSLGGTAIAVSVGGSSCALLASGGVRCWGDNTSGELGDGTTIDRHAPVDVVSLGGSATSISVGLSYACATLSSGSVRCWGSNLVGELGDGTTIDRNIPVDVVSLGGAAVAVAAGDADTCALLASGGVRCWGTNEDGSLGIPITHLPSYVYPPVDVASLGGSATLVSVGLDQTCALLTSGTTRCWGLSQWNNNLSIESKPPTSVDLGGPVISLSAGNRHACAVLASNTVRCWGVNTAGQLGDGTANLSSTPVTVVDLP